MINFKNITQAAETLLTAQAGDDFVIERNPVRPAEPLKVMRDGKKGWIGIYRAGVKYEPYATGSIPWIANIRFTVEIQVASTKSGDDCEDKLCDAEKQVIDIFEADRKTAKLSGYVANIIGYEIEYAVNEDEQTYYQAALITVIAEQRT